MVPVRPLSVAIVPESMVAVTTPVVLASMMLAWATVAVPVLTFAATLLAVSMVAADIT